MAVSYTHLDVYKRQVVCHDELDHIAFVGHAGVMITDGSDVYFVEKSGPTSPYQAAKFQTKAQVREYLLNRFWKLDVYKRQEKNRASGK